MVAFSRLQLAAALIEYDNDPDDPGNLRSAQDSAIFSHIRTRNAPRARTLSGFEHLRETPNLLGVDIPNSDPGSGRGHGPDPRRSLAGTRNSRSSVDVLRNPFDDDIPESEQGVDDEKSDDGEDGEDLEVDLEAWGMTNFLGKEKDKSRPKDLRSGQRSRQPSKTQSEVMSNAHSRLSVDEFGQLNASTRRASGARSKSIGSIGVGDDPLLGMQGGAAVASEADFRRRSISMGVSLDAAALKFPDSDDPSLSATGLAQRQHNRTRTQSQQFDMQSIPFPSSSPVPPEENKEDNIFAVPLTSYTSRFDPKSAPQTRRMSNGSLNSQTMLDYRLPSSPETADENPPVLRPISPSGATWFDPRGAPVLSSGPQGFPPMSDVDSRARVSSIATQGYMDDNPFSLPPPSPSRVSRFDPKAAAHARTISNASFGSRRPLEADRMSVASGQMLESDVRHTQRYSRLELMRPKVLIMPSPLQGAEEAPPPPSVPPGFQLSTVGPPLPPGAQSAARPISRAFSSMDGPQVATSSNSFTPNPRTSMSLSQLTFRNTLLSGGQRDIAYVDIESGLRRAQEDGEQIYQEENIEEEVAEEQKQALGKPPGKLYGRSLMDELQARKDKIRSKQRVFTGDERPSMMSRGQIRRSSTLIDPATLQERPQSQTFGRPPMRRGSSGSKPLLDFSDESPANGAPNAQRMQNSKSVFGVDSLWERELDKLAQIEAAEKAEEEENMRIEEERQRMEEEKAAKKARRKGKGKGKGKGKRRKAARGESPETAENLPRPSAVGDLPPTLPAIPKTTARRPRQPIADAYDSESDSEASESAAKAKAAARQESGVGWESSDDEGRRRAPRNTESDSEDDMPLARHIPAIRPPSSDSEDEKPLAKVLERKNMVPDINFDSLPGLKGPVPAADDDEDDTPLALQRPHVQSFVRQSTAANNDDDDDDDEEPLGLKQAQRAQYNMMSQQQMMEMQLRNSMAFGAPSMLNAFPPFVMPPPVLGTMAAPYDPGKYQSVDRWRHNVAAE